jgi:putative transposase
MKGGSSKFMNETFFTRKVFAWQDGYAAFSIGTDAVGDVVEYIQNQREHHKKQSFEEEYIAFLEENWIEYDIRYVFD